MIARFINYNGPFGAETIGLCLAQPNLRTTPKLNVEWISDVAKHALSKRESRHARAVSGRFTAEFLSTMRNAADATDLRMFLNALNIDQTVAIPLWEDGCRITSARSSGATVLPIDQPPARFGAEWIVMNSDASIYEIVTVSSFAGISYVILNSPGLANNWGAGTTMFPLVFGRLDGRPDLTATGPSRSEFTLKFKETSRFERIVSPFASTITTVGAQISNLSALPLWTLHPNWVKVLDRSEVETIWSQLGFGRVDAALVYNRPVARGLEMTFQCRNRREIAWLEYFVSQLTGQVGTFMIPSFRNDLVLTSDLPIGGNPTQITIAQPNEYSDAGRTPHPGDPYLAIVDPINPAVSQIGQVTIDPHKIDIVAGANLTTDANVVLSHSKALARLSALLICRLVDPKIAWTYSGPARATCTLKFIELPYEYTSPSPVLKKLADLYFFIEAKKYPSTVLVTSYEKAITIAQGGAYDGTYQPAQVGHKSLRKSVDPSQSKMEIDSAFAGNPISKFFPWRLEGLLNLTHLTCNVNDLTEPLKVRFTGQVKEPNPALTQASVQPFGAILDLMIPCHLLMAVDNYELGDAALGIDPEAYELTGPISAIAGNVITVTCAAAFAQTADYFADGGWVELGADSDHYESRMILHSVPHAPDKVDLTLERPLNFNIVGASVDMFPGYDGTIDQLDTRYNDRINFGAFAYVPDTPPNIKAVATKSPGTGKGGK